MLQVLQRKDGRYTVHDVGGAVPNNVSGVFDSRSGAEAWLLDHSLKAKASNSGLNVMRLGGGQDLS